MWSSVCLECFRSIGVDELKERLPAFLGRHPVGNHRGRILKLLRRHNVHLKQSNHFVARILDIRAESEGAP